VGGYAHSAQTEQLTMPVKLHLARMLQCDNKLEKYANLRPRIVVALHLA